MLNNRMLSLRHKKINAIFKVQNIITDSLREFLNKEGFTEIHTPKIVKEGAEGGTEVFEVKYFENKAYLAQSPQFYKQMMVGAGFERVFEIGHVKEGAEGGTEVFEVKYFENKAYLAQSPQFYKQMMVGAGFERVFEIGHAYRAEEH